MQHEPESRQLINTQTHTILRHVEWYVSEKVWVQVRFYLHFKQSSHSFKGVSFQFIGYTHCQLSPVNFHTLSIQFKFNLKSTGGSHIKDSACWLAVIKHCSIYYEKYLELLKVCGWVVWVSPSASRIKTEDQDSQKGESRINLSLSLFHGSIFLSLHFKELD